MKTTRVALIAGSALLMCAVLHGSADADPIKCSRTIAKESAKYRATVSKVIAKCKTNVITKVGGSPGGLCPDGPGAQKIADSALKMKAKIAGACGGSDRVCGTPDGDDGLASIRWNIGTCMGFEGQCLGIAISDCGGIGDCLECIGNEQVEQALDDLLYDQFESGDFYPNNGVEPQKTLNKCQVTIAKSAAKFLTAKEKILNKCWDAKLKGKDGFNDSVKCPDTDPKTGSGNPPASPGDVKTVEAIKKAEQKKVAAICKACGAGGDANKDGLCDVPPGFLLDDIVATVPFDCPDVQVPPNAVHPAGLDCNAITVTDLQSYVDCIDCVLEFKADCATDAGVGDSAPALGIDYPAECSGVGGACPTTYSFTANGPAADLDYGWSGIAHDEHLPSNATLTATVSGCASPTVPCGSCTLSGPITNGAGPALDNRRCRGDDTGNNGSWIECTSDAQCPGAGNACTYFFGPPQPISTGGVSFCLTNEMSGAIAGTVTPQTGAATFTLPMTIKNYAGGAVDDPCPKCVGGFCSGGQRNGMACTVNGTSALFADDVSLDCPPSFGLQIGVTTSALPLTTGVETATLSAASPSCTAVGYTSFRCMCDTCNNAAATPCMSNADCTAVGATICGGLRCLGGVDAGTPCASGAGCSSSMCARAGEPTKPSACSSNDCVDNTPPDNDSVDEGQCQTAPNDSVCSTDTYRGCFSNSDCRPPAEGGSCATCTPGLQTCVTVRRQCFTANGAVGDDVAAGGVASPTAPTLAGLSCGPVTASGAVNTVWGLPGLVRYTMPGTSTFN